MINKALLKKSIYEDRWLWFTCAVVLFVFCWVHVMITSQIDMGRFEAILKLLPDQLEKFSPVPFEKLISYPARIAIIFEEPLVYTLMTIWCIARSSDVVSGELGRGTMEMLLAQPVSRLQIFLTPVCVTVCGIALLACVAWGGTCTGIATTFVERPAPGSSWTIPFTAIEMAKDDAEMQQIPMSRLADYRLLLPAAISYFCLGVFLSGVCTLLSSFDSYRWRTIGIMMGFYICQMLSEVVGQAFPRLEWLRQISFFRAYEPTRFVSESVSDASLGWAWVFRDSSGQFVDIGPLACDAILLGLGLVSFCVAAVYFCKRDLPAPI